MKKENIENYIIYTILKKIYSYYDINLDKSIFKDISYDYIEEYKLPFIYILNTINDKNIIIKYIDYYYKNNKNYPEKFRLSKLSSKILKMIISKEKNIFNENNIIIQNEKSVFMYEKAKEYINSLKNKNN